MLTVSLDCPFCRTINAGFRVLSGANYPVPQADYGTENAYQAMALCNKCNTGIVVVVSGAGLHHYFQYGDFSAASRYDFQILNHWPEFEEQEAPDHVPADIAEEYRAAMHSYTGRFWGAAAMQFRRVLEQSIPRIDPNAKGKLVEMIRNLPSSAGAGDLIKDLANALRFIGNDGAHGQPGTVTEEVATEAQEFTELFLTYVFTLPAKVKGSSAYNKIAAAKAAKNP